jgi:hypothetical protein
MEPIDHPANESATEARCEEPKRTLGAATASVPGLLARFVIGYL